MGRRVVFRKIRSHLFKRRYDNSGSVVLSLQPLNIKGRTILKLRVTQQWKYVRVWTF